MGWDTYDYEDMGDIWDYDYKENYVQFSIALEKEAFDKIDFLKDTTIYHTPKEIRYTDFECAFEDTLYNNLEHIVDDTAYARADGFYVINIDNENQKLTCKFCFTENLNFYKDVKLHFDEKEKIIKLLEDTMKKVLREEYGITQNDIVKITLGSSKSFLEFPNTKSFLELQDKNVNHTICFTGRRPKDLCGYNREAYPNFVKDLTDFLEKEFYANGGCRFITGGAQGFDQLAFWSVNHLKEQYNHIENIVYIPFQEQSSAWKKEGVFSQKEYNQMLKNADEIYVLSEIDNTDKKQVVEAMYHRNHQMIDNSNIVVALYPDDTWRTNMKSGTSETMRYAHEQGKTICQICYEIKDNKLLFGNVKYIEGKKKEQEISNEDKENDEMER